MFHSVQKHQEPLQKKKQQKAKYHHRKGVKFHFDAKNPSFQFSSVFHVSQACAKGRSGVRCPVWVHLPGQNRLVPL